MRITNKMIAANMLARVADNRARAAKLQLDIATTKKLRRPSDDPAGVVQLQRMKALISRNQQYSDNLNLMRDFMTNSVAALDGVLEHLESAKEIAVRASSGTIGTEARQTLSQQVDQILDLIVDLGNTKYRNRYLFAGTLTQGDAPFTRSGDNITYNGNTKGMEGQIGFEARIVYNKTGDEVFSPAGGTDIFATLAALKQGLEADDDTAIQNSIDSLNSAIDHIISVSSEIGVLQDRLDSTEQLIESENVRFADTVSKIQDTDVVQALVDSQLMTNAINSGLQTMANLVQRSLVDFVS